MKNGRIRSSKTKGTIQAKTEWIENRGIPAACHNAAVNIVTSGPKISLEDRKMWRKGLGKPSTITVLPSGDVHDTNDIGVSSKHATNNKLGIKGKENLYPGTKSNLKIDYSNQCQQYKDFFETDSETMNKKK